MLKIKIKMKRKETEIAAIEDGSRFQVLILFSAKTTKTALKTQNENITEMVVG